MNQKETMKNMPKSERPYEKCMEQGPQVLSDAELLAVIMGLRSVMGSFPELIRANEPVEIYSDSAYFCNCIKDKWYVNWQNNGWLNAKKQPVENKSLWEEIINLMNYANVTVNKVKGHANNEINNYVDNLAKKAAKGETNYEV